MVVRNRTLSYLHGVSRLPCVKGAVSGVIFGIVLQWQKTSLRNLLNRQSLRHGFASESVPPPFTQGRLGAVRYVLSRKNTLVSPRKGKNQKHGLRRAFGFFAVTLYYCFSGSRKNTEGSFSRRVSLTIARAVELYLYWVVGRAPYCARLRP